MLSTEGAPWQRAYIERVIGTIRRECLDHVIVVNERTLRRHLKSFVAYYQQTRTHLGLQKDAPMTTPVHGPDSGRIVGFPEVVGLTIDTSAEQPEQASVFPDGFEFFHHRSHC